MKTVIIKHLYNLIFGLNIGYDAILQISVNDEFYCENGVKFSTVDSPLISYNVIKSIISLSDANVRSGYSE